MFIHIFFIYLVKVDATYTQSTSVHLDLFT